MSYIPRMHEGDSFENLPHDALHLVFGISGDRVYIKSDLNFQTPRILTCNVIIHLVCQVSRDWLQTGCISCTNSLQSFMLVAGIGSAVVVP